MLFAVGNACLKTVQLARRWSTSRLRPSKGERVDAPVANTRDVKIDLLSVASGQANRQTSVSVVELCSCAMNEAEAATRVPLERLW